MRLILKDRRLGIAEDTGRYDLPFYKDHGTDFLLLLVALMTFLAVMALAASFVLDGMSKRWSSGLENRLTIEIPAETSKGDVREAGDIETLKTRVGAALKDDPHVESFQVLGKEDMQALLEPWMGGNSIIDSIPLPGLVSVEMKTSGPQAMDILQKEITAVDPTITVDTHEEWLKNLLRLTGTLGWVTFLVTTIIAVTTVLAVSGAVRARMAIHRADVELLHLMGANDNYITKQFQRHTLILALKGGIYGTVVAGLVLIGVHSLSGSGEEAVLPGLSLKVIQIMLLMAPPVAACAIAALTARITVLRALSQMP